MNYQEEFITFMVRSGVLTFGDFTTKSGRKTPYFVNTGNYKTGAQAARLGLAPDYNLENQKPLFLQAGFRVVYANQDYMDTEDGLCHCFILTAGKKGGRPC